MRRPGRTNVRPLAFKILVDLARVNGEPPDITAVTKRRQV
jgi:hypothetical protein